MEQTIFFGVQSLAVFLFTMTLLPWLFKRGHRALSVIFPLCLFLIFALLNPHNFDFIERIWRGLALGIVVVALGFVYFNLSKRSRKNLKS